MGLEVGSIVIGTVSAITKFGVFVDLPGDKKGLVHISEVADAFVDDIRNFVKEHSEIRVKILGINDKGNYELSLKRAAITTEPASPAPSPQKRNTQREKEFVERSMPPSFEDKLSRFMKESEERLLDLKRSTEAKRGGGTRRPR